MEGRPRAHSGRFMAHDVTIIYLNRILHAAGLFPAHRWPLRDPLSAGCELWSEPDCEGPGTFLSSRG